jgi:hypothetical protein
MPTQPQGVVPSRAGVWAAAPIDTNGNGYLDTIDVTVYISSDSYPAPIAVPGSFEFRLIGKNGAELARWPIDETSAAAAVRNAPAGPAYIFRLNILDVGTDNVEAQAVDLSAEFRPKQGQPVHAPVTSLPRFGHNKL